jgi:hypothetical protein
LPSSHVTSPPSSPLKSNPILSPLSTSLISTTLHKETLQLSVKLLKGPLQDPQPPPSPSSRDLSLEVGVTLKTLKYLHLFSGSWVM